MPKSVTLPSGLAGTIRGLKVAEANLLANAMEQKRGTALDSVYASIWLSTDALGPYESVKGAVDASGKVGWGKVLVADRFVLMLETRIATYGGAYAFRVRCSDQQCGAKFEWELDLSDLPRKPIPALALEALANGNRMSAEFPTNGAEFWFRLLDGDGEKSAEKLMKQNGARKLTAALASRIIEIQGVHSNDKLKFLDDLEMSDANAVLAVLDTNDGGVETTIEVECPDCGEGQELNLPFGKEFWVPSKRMKPVSPGTTPSQTS